MNEEPHDAGDARARPGEIEHNRLGMQSRDRLAANSRWNLLAFSFTLAAHFVTVPYVVGEIGLSAFGEAGLVLACWAPLQLIGTVLGQASTREMALDLSRSSPARAGAVAGTARMLTAGACLIVGMLFLWLAPGLLSALFGRAPGDSPLPTLFLIASLGWAAQQGVLLQQSISAAQQDYRTFARVSAVSAITTIAATISCTALWPTSAGYLGGVSASFLATLLAWWMAQRSSNRTLGIAWRWDREQALRLLHFGKWQGLSHLVGSIGLQMDRYMLGALTSTLVVGFYNVAARLQEVVHIALLKMFEVLLPHFSVTADTTVQERAPFFLAASWLVNTVAACALVPLIPLAQPLITLWIDADTAHGAAPILQVLAMVGAVGACTQVYVYHAMGTGQPRSLAVLMVIQSAVTIVVSVVAITLAGPLAAGMGALAGGVVRLGLGWYLSHKSFEGGFSMLALWLHSAPPLLSGLLIGWTCWHMKLLSPTNWAALGMSYVVLAIGVAALSSGVACLTPQGRRMLVDIVATALRFRRGRV